MVLTSVLLAAAIVAADPSADTNSVAAAAVPAKTNRIAKITSATTYYDAKVGVALFSGHVYVDDEEHQLHSDTAYVFMDTSGTNELKRIVAVGNVAITNETRRAYGSKAAYYRDSGMVVLYAPKEGLCEVRDEKSDPPQIVQGTKIKFWIGSEQVEVQGASISAPVSGGVNGLKSLTGGRGNDD